MTPVTFRRAWLAQTLVCALLSAAAAPALAQTQDDLFNDSAVQDLQLTVSSRDWEALKAHADENTYYAADLRWRGVTVRNVGIRSRGASTRNGVKPGLRVDMNRYVDQSFLGLRALVLDNALHRPVDAARGAGDEAVRARRAAGPARGARAAVRQQRVRRPLHRGRAHRSHVRGARLRRGRRQRRKRRLSSTNTPGCGNTASSTWDRRSSRTRSSSSPGRARPTPSRGCISRSKPSRALINDTPPDRFEPGGRRAPRPAGVRALPGGAAGRPARSTASSATGA